MKDLIELGLWNDTMRNRLISTNGSVLSVPGIPQNIKDLYKTVWEISQKIIIDMSADRGAYICQSQSLNLYMPVIDVNRLGSMHLYAWKQGLKTGLYYLRIRPVAKTQQFTLAPTAVGVVQSKAAAAAAAPGTESEAEAVPYCTREAGCITCSS